MNLTPLIPGLATWKDPYLPDTMKINDPREPYFELAKVITKQLKRLLLWANYAGHDRAILCYRLGQDEREIFKTANGYALPERPEAFNIPIRWTKDKSLIQIMVVDVNNYTKKRMSES